MSSSEPFIHLHLHSAYSLAEGAIRVKDLIKRCKLNNMPAVAITDTNNLFGALEFALAAQDEGVQPIIGCQITMEDGKYIVLLVQSQTGYLNLSKLVSDGYMNGAGGKDFVVSYDVVAERAEGLICLSGGNLNGVSEEVRLQFLKNAFGDRFYIELQRHDDPREDAIEPASLTSPIVKMFRLSRPTTAISPIQKCMKRMMRCSVLQKAVTSRNSTAAA